MLARLMQLGTRNRAVADFVEAEQAGLGCNDVKVLQRGAPWTACSRCLGRFRGQLRRAFEAKLLPVLFLCWRRDLHNGKVATGPGRGSGIGENDGKNFKYAKATLVKQGEDA